MEAKKPSVVVVFGSQTGNAESIAKSLHVSLNKQLANEGIKAGFYCMKDFAQFSLENCDIGIFVTSSTGQGDPPDNALRFNRYLHRDHPKDFLRNLHYTVLGLGDTNYDTFQGFPRLLDEMLSSLGAKTFYPRGEADDATGLEEVVESWKENLLPALKKQIAELSTPTSHTVLPESAAAPPAESKAVTETAQPQPTPTVPAEPTETQQPQQPQQSTETPGAAKKPPPKKKIIIKRQEIPDIPPCTVEVVYQPKGTVALRLPSTPETAEKGEEEEEAGETYSQDSPFIAPLVGARRLTALDSEKTTLELEIDTTGAQFKWLPGDAFAIVCHNPAEIVDKVIAHLGLEAEAVFGMTPLLSATLPAHINTPCTVREAFQNGIDLFTPPKKALLRLLAEYTTKAEEKESLMNLCSAKGAKAYMDEIVQEQVGLAELLLERFPSCKPTFAHLLSVAPPLQPRYFSMANSPLAHPNRIRFAFAVVRYTTAKGRKRQGLCTPWLEQLVQPLLDGSSAPTGLSLPIFFRPTREFVVPQDLSKPIVMVGPGTGVAPFIGFLEHRAALGVKSAAGGSDAWWLFFGCRYESKDYLYRDEIQELLKKEALSELSVAFSRDTEEVVYVQHRMVEHGARLCSLLLQQKAVLFICGDAKGMAKGVTAALLQIFKEHGGLDETSALQAQTLMFQEKRILMDVWA